MKPDLKLVSSPAPPAQAAPLAPEQGEMPFAMVNGEPEVIRVGCGDPAPFMVEA